MTKFKIIPGCLARLKIGAGLLIFLVFISSVGCKNKQKDIASAESADLLTVKENNSTVTDYISFTANDTNKMTLDHTYTNEALLKLTGAVSAIADEVGFDIKGDLEKAAVCANNITKNPFETSHADEIRKAADILSGILQNIQVAKYPGLANEAGAVKTAAIAIDPETLTLDQKDVVKSFFSKAAYLLEKMN